MTKLSDGPGRVDNDPSAAGSLLSFAEVEARLVEAVRVSWRLPDREAGWQRVRSAWPEIMREAAAGDYDARGGDLSSSDVKLRTAAATRGEVADMEQAFDWLRAVEDDDRRLVALAIGCLARGDKQVPWLRLRRPMGLTHGAEGLRKRYTRALGRACRRANQGLLRREAGQGGISNASQI
ncbi:DUF6362 family protein [Sphingomonas hankookensis]|uniref:DUF6362 family protein n=1 Tax=Sphingomonas hankookensis TaxID=563996 RepID=UPI00234E8728|nr:DUF6362 family protein [Sphingomonas hankookensis]WCP71564.1 DUF6362 family protein [Sphingomonas hankookensis]